MFLLLRVGLMGVCFNVLGGGLVEMAVLISGPAQRKQPTEKARILPLIESIDDVDQLAPSILTLLIQFESIHASG